VRRRCQSDAALAGWRPKIVQYVSPQVWASRPGRARKLAEAVDLLLCTFPFERDWYAQRVPELKVEFVGNPIVDRYASAIRNSGNPEPETRNPKPSTLNPKPTPLLLLLPGSRRAEVRRHLPLLCDALRRMQSAKPGLRARMILPAEDLKALVESTISPRPPGLEVQVGGLETALAEADVALTKSGTVTLELAYFGVPSVVFYKTSWITYLIGRLAVSVKYLAMPNLLADEELFPEFIQHRATGENLAQAALEFLDQPARRAAVRERLQRVLAGLGEPGASRRAARGIAALLERP
jgi:lipid-A-disaccharide synthase